MNRSPLRAAAAALLACGLAPAQFGARFEPTAGRILHGVGQESFSTAAFNRVPQYEAAMGVALAPAIDKTYLTLSLYLTSPRNPRARFLSYLGSVAATGKVPEVGIDILPDAAVVAGAYDAEITQMARDFAGYSMPNFARPGVEIANGWNAYSPTVFPAAWRHVVDVFRRENADNVAFVWCIAAAGYSTFDTFDAQGNGLWYPGDEYVDWIGLDLFDASNFSGASPPGSSHSNSLALCAFAWRRKKPVMIAECTAKGLGIMAAGNAQAYWNAWFQPFFGFLDAHPVIREFSYINWDWSLTTQWPTWLNADLTVNASLTALYLQQLSQPRYLHKGPTSPFVGPWPVRLRVDASGQPISFGFDGLTPGVDVYVAFGLRRIVADPGTGERDRDYGLELPPAGWLKVDPLVVVSAGPAPASGPMTFTFPPQTGPATVYVQALHDGRLSTELRIDF
ncbi:MAG: hypothetical protein IPM29_29630 [Planctomycetes bacterium]|nr:hypothetical protein [Planctomycetota bacterium]